MIKTLNETTEILSVNNDGRFINRTSQVEGWNSILNFAPSETTKDVVVMMSDSYSFKNNFDKKLFEDKLNQLRTDLGKRVIIVSPGKNDTLM